MIEFDFELEVERMLPKITDDTINAEIGSFRVGDQKHRIIVCRHWLSGLCHNGSLCSYLHRMDKHRMPLCRNGKLCKLKNCPLKHVADEDLEECLFFKQGFCYNGPKCTRRHLKRTPDECLVEYPFEQVTYAQATVGKRLKVGQRNDNFRVTLCTHWLLSGHCPFGEECHYAHGEDELHTPHTSDFFYDSDIYDPTKFVLGVPLELPFPMASRCSYFVLQSPDLRSLAVSKRRGIWAVSTRIAAEMNAAFRSSDFVILFFEVRPLRGIYGVAKLNAIIPPSAPHIPITPEFPVTWLRTFRISLSTVSQLKLGTSGMFVGRSYMDGRFDNKVGLDMLLVAYRKPVWDWTLEIVKTEKHIRLKDPAMFGGKPGPVGEYYPPGGVAAYYLPPDVLFAQDWIDRAGLAVNEKGTIIMQRPPVPIMANVGPPAEFYRGTQQGFIVCGSTPVIEEMFARTLFGLPLQFKDLNIPPKVPMFIYDTQANVMLGIFHAASPVMINKDVKAFAQCGPGDDGGSPLPVQLNFQFAMECPPIHIPIQDPELQAALGEYITNMGQIGLQETKDLANLFARRAFAAFPNLFGRQMIAPLPPQSPQAFQAQGTLGGYYRPPFRCVEVVPVEVVGNPYETKKRILGPNAIYIKNLTDSIAPNAVRMRLRGIGSNFIEGPNQAELQEPLHFNVCAENEQFLQLAVTRLKEFLSQVSATFGNRK